MIGISTQTYDIAGARVFRRSERTAGLGNMKGSRRVTRTATLDGGVAIYDTGYSDSDRDIVATEPDADVSCIDFARYIVTMYGLVTVTMEDGVYTGVPETYQVNRDGALEMKILLTAKLSQ
ncbi:MAG: hypothetical protein WCJ37_01085 [Syntrophus sp. (in: bacteria)]